MSRGAIDIEKLRVALRRLSRGNLLIVAERAIEIAPRAKLRQLVVRSRPALQESWRRHERVIEAKRLPVAWLALWRLPPAMTWSESGEKPWMRYPAVSFVTAVRPLHRKADGRI